MSNSETIVAAATPTGRSALAVIRIDGPLAATIACAAFGRSTTPAARRATTAVWRDLVGAPVDQVVAVLAIAPHSFTGNDSLEVTCHGNPLLVRRLVEDCLARGCRSAEPGEFTRRAFLAGKLDLTQAEAIADLIHASSERALASARRQLAGELGGKSPRGVTSSSRRSQRWKRTSIFPKKTCRPRTPMGPCKHWLRLSQNFLDTLERPAMRPRCGTAFASP